MSTGSPVWSRMYQLTGVMRPGGLSKTQRALGHCALPRGARVLDVGCGIGATVKYLEQQGLAAVGIDPCAAYLQSGRLGRTGAALVQAVGELLPFANGSMDAIVAECSLSLMRADTALGEFARVLRPGGRLVLSDLYLRRAQGVPNLQRLSLGGCLGGAWSEAQLGERLGAHGFSVSFWEDCSPALRQLTAQWIMSGGSSNELWCQGACTDTQLDAEEIERAVSAARPGYFLLVAERDGLVCSHTGSNWEKP